MKILKALKALLKQKPDRLQPIEPSEMNYLVAGLGNIGDEYASTRHNMGFMVLDAWAQASNAVFNTERYGDVAIISFKGRKIYLLKPSTYMNLSGKAVRYWLNKLNLPLGNLLVICDDLNLPFGTIRMRKSGSDGGHNGLKDIEACLETSQWSRIRIGIPAVRIANRYGKINAPPPFVAAIYGNLHRLPRPTAEPIAASMKPSLLFH